MQSQTYQDWEMIIIDDDGNESLPSDLIEVETLPEFIPDSPHDLELIPGQNYFYLTWSPVFGYGDPIGGAAVSYNIYRFDINDFNLDNISDSNIIGSTVGVNATSYTDSNLNDNMYYCYGISAINSENAEGNLSQVLCEITYGQLPTSIPSNINSTPGNQQVYLSWTASEGSPIINYQIYRSGDGYNNEFVANTAVNSYSDLGLSKNTSYLKRL